MKYECMYIIQAALEDQERADLVERINQLVISNGGEVEKVDDWGKRRLAYPIDYQNEGHYILMHFAADSEFPRELERNFQNTEQIIRYLVTRVDA